MISEPNSEDWTMKNIFQDMDEGRSLAFLTVGIQRWDNCHIPLKISSKFQEDLALPERLLLQGRPFTYLRWGDGEWLEALKPNSRLFQSMKRYAAHEAKGNFFPILGAFFFCGSGSSLGDRVGAAIEKLDNAEIPSFYNRFYMDVFGIMHAIRHPSSEEGSNLHVQWNASKFGVDNFDNKLSCDDTAQNKRPVVVVGEAHVNKLTKFLQHEMWIDASGAESRQNDILEKILEASSRWPNENVVFLVAVHIVGRLIGEEAYQKIGDKDSIIDIGSALDPLTSACSRDWHANARKSLCKTARCFVIGCEQDSNNC